jgi:hypothetical protein
VCLSPAGGTEVRFATVHAVGDSHDAVHLGGSDTTIRDAALTADAGFALSVTAGTGNRVLTSTLNAATPWFSVAGSSGTAVAIHNSFLHGDITLNAAVLALRSTEVIGDNLQAVIFAAGGATAYVEDSAVIGDFMEISGAGSKVRIGASRLEIPSGIITDAGGSAACVASYDASFAPLGC